MEIKVVDSNLNTVAKGFGSLTEEIAPGIYQIEYRAADRFKRELVAIGPNESLEKHDLDLEFSTPVPLEGTSTSHEYYRDAVERLSTDPAGDPALDSALFVFIRNASRDGKLPLSAETIGKWRLINSERRPVPDVLEQFRLDSAEGWLGLCVRVPAGNYAIESVAGKKTLRQAVEVSGGWITGLFISNTPQGPSVGGASIQMSRMGVGFPGFDSQRHQVRRFVELALAGLREGRSVLPPDHLLMLLREKFSDPILGFAGAHALLLRREPDLHLLAEVLQNLEQLVPGHQDLNALRHIGAGLGAKISGTRPRPASWPPMFSASYRGLLRCDAGQARVIEDGSVAETVAATFCHGGLWTTWQPSLEMEVELGAAAKSVMRSLNFPADSSLIFPADSPELESPKTRTATISVQSLDRVRRFLREAGVANRPKLRGQLLNERNISQIALTLGLPVSLTRRTIEATWALEPKDKTAVEPSYVIPEKPVIRKREQGFDYPHL
jgi:hypothetical protein